MRTAFVKVPIEIPDGATHYDLLNMPTFWKQQTNSTGVITAWYYSTGQGDPWFYQSEDKPHWLTEIPFA